MKPPTASAKAGLQEASRSLAKQRYVLRLYVAGVSPRSERAVANVRRLCEEHLPDRYDLEIVDIYQQLGRAVEQGVIAAPTLIKSLPLPLRRFLGDMSNTEKILVGLDLHTTESSPPPGEPA